MTYFVKEEICSVTAVSFGTVHHTHTHTHARANSDLIKYAATPSNQPQRCILTDYFNNYNFSKLK